MAQNNTETLSMFSAVCTGRVVVMVRQFQCVRERVIVKLYCSVCRRW